ncbi:uncharacterized protein LOC127753293 [Oryza glaberrima]|uniref:uncharacterized protein LOC127753293 n=1 Tax=Oryza glaberrima TaxID=4538 RepID=UPI00224C5814|nr:uncharacterized protein LOC127753293 [Oryza glaberrima]
MIGMQLTIRPAAARSASLPREHSHPVVARLDGGISALRSWSAAAARLSGVDGDGRCDGLALVEDVLEVLGELLGLPQAAAAIHRAAGGAACERALDGFLALADAYGTFESAVLALRQSAAELRAGARRGDGATVATALRAHRRTERELCRLAAAMRHAVRRTPAAASRTANDADGEVVGIVAEAAAVTAAASEAIFLRCAAMSRDVSAMVQTAASHKWLAWLGVTRAAKKAASPALEKLEELEECIGEMESGSEKVFRRLLQTRVSLLNIHNPL